MYKSMKKRTMILAAVFSLCIAGGCGAQSPAVDMNDTNMTQVSETGVPEESENMTQVSETETAADDKTDEIMTQISQYGASVKENEEYVY